MNTSPQTELDRLVLAHRADPTEANRAALMAEQQAHFERFLQTQTIDFQRRTH